MLGSRGRKLIWVLLATVLVVVVGTPVFFLATPPQAHLYLRLRAAERYAEEAEVFQARHGRFPDPFEMGERPTGVNYYRHGSGYFVSAQGLGFDVSYTFDPLTKRWSFEEDE